MVGTKFQMKGNFGDDVSDVFCDNVGDIVGDYDLFNR
jgi:hypothetical protein